jgi:hypothetical protein
LRSFLDHTPERVTERPTFIAVRSGSALGPTEEAFRELRRRIEVEGAADGDVRDFESH